MSGVGRRGLVSGSSDLSPLGDPGGDDTPHVRQWVVANGSKTQFSRYERHDSQPPFISPTHLLLEVPDQFLAELFLQIRS